MRARRTTILMRADVRRDGVRYGTLPTAGFWLAAHLVSQVAVAASARSALRARLGEMPGAGSTGRTVLTTR
jgi:hypothetical protein